MPRFLGTPDFAHDLPDRLGVLVTNLGTPDAPTPAAVRRYLAEFLWDPRVVEFPRPLWWLVLNGIILRVRPRKVAKSYASIWTDAGAPLLDIARRQQAALQAELERTLPGPVVVALGMRYGNPSIASALRQLHEAGARRLLVLPLYPQYSATTTGSTFDALAEELRQWRWLPELRMVTHYHDDPGYIDALANSIREQRDPEARLLMSFHGVPRRYLDAGDPYHCECHKTARLLAERLGLADDEWQIGFQSRFGREEWLKPYTDHLLRDWAREGVRKVQVVCPGFSADCLETLEEIAEQNHDLFLTHGGESLHYIPALNDRADHIAALADIVRRSIADWPEAQAGHDAAAEAAARAERARALGAPR